MDMESVKKICVLGRYFGDPRLAVLFEYLDEGVESGWLEYQRFDADKPHPDFSKFDGYIYIGTMPKKTDKPYIKIKYNESEDNIAEFYSKFINDLLNISPEEISDNKNFDKFEGFTVEFKNKEFKFNKSDASEIRELLSLCKEFNFNIKEVIVDEHRQQS